MTLRELWERTVVGSYWLALHLTGRRVPSIAALKWWRSETRTRARMERRLGEYLSLPEQLEEVAFDLVALTASQTTVASTASYRVHSTLVARVLSDLRATVLLCVRGYTMQGWAAAASCFEHSYSIGYVGKDEERAKRWLTHTNFQQPPWGCYDSVLHTIRFLDIATSASDLETLVKREYRLYERMCMGKHGSPIAEKKRYFARAEEGKARLVFTPVFTEGRLREAKLAIVVASRAVGTGLWAYLTANAAGAEEPQTRLLRVVERTHALMADLNEPDVPE